MLPVTPVQRTPFSQRHSLRWLFILIRNRNNNRTSDSKVDHRTSKSKAYCRSSFPKKQSGVSLCPLVESSSQKSVLRTLFWFEFLETKSIPTKAEPSVFSSKSRRIKQIKSNLFHLQRLPLQQPPITGSFQPLILHPNSVSNDSIGSNLATLFSHLFCI